MIKRILLGGLLAALTFVVVPINSASADHVVEPCSDPDAQQAGLVETGTIDHSNKHDVWHLPQAGTPLREYNLVADAPISVKMYLDSSFGCGEIQGTRCVETHAPHICEGSAPDWQGDLYLVVEKVDPPISTNTGADYVLQVTN